MNFLDAKKVEFVRCTQRGQFKTELYTDSCTDQIAYFAFKGKDDALREELNIVFDREQQIPHKFSLSANQYTMTPLEMEIALYKFGATEPYNVTMMEPLRTFVVLEPGTTRIVIACNNDKCNGKSTRVKFSVNYIEF